MKVEQMTSSRGNKVPNQFIITDDEGSQTFQSYNSIIVKIVRFSDGDKRTYVDAQYWDYSKTTGTYRNQFLGETKKETQAKIDTGEYILENLN